MPNFFRKPIPVFVVCLILICPLVVSTGCGGPSVPTGKVQGKVLFDGEPYSGAAVVFFNSATGQGGTANIQSDGTFKIAQPIPVGSYVVYLAPEIAEPDPATEEAQGPKPVFMTGNDVPDKYWNEADSDVKFEITEGNNDVTVELKKE